MPDQSAAVRSAAGSTPAGPTLQATVEGAVKAVTPAEVALLRSWAGDLLADH
jgi:hypothetical protein